MSLLFSFARRFLPHIKPATTRRFLQHMKDYLDATAREAELREEDLVADLDTYTRLRRNNSGVLYCFDMIEYILDFEVPDAMFNQAAFTKMHLAAADMVTYANVSAQSHFYLDWRAYQDNAGYLLVQSRASHGAREQQLRDGSTEREEPDAARGSGCHRPTSPRSLSCVRRGFQPVVFD